MVTLQSDKKLDVTKLRLDLKPFKAANVSANHVRTWEKNHYIVLVFGGVGLAYFLLEYTDLSVVAVMCLLAWLITIWDYFMPHITIKESVEACYTSLFKEPNSLGLVIMKSIALLAVPWIVCWQNTASVSSTRELFDPNAPHPSNHQVIPNWPSYMYAHRANLLNSRLLLACCAHRNSAKNSKETVAILHNLDAETITA